MTATITAATVSSTAEAPGTAPLAPRKDWRKKSRGQGLVEFAMIAPLLFLMLALAADFGRAFTAYIAISSAAREGASYGSQSFDNANNASGIQNAALADSPTIWGVAPSVTVSNASTLKDNWSYRYVQVTVAYSFSPIMKIPPIPNTVTMTRTVRMRVVN